MNLLSIKIAILLYICLLFSCSKDEELNSSLKKIPIAINKKPTANFIFNELHDRFVLESTSQDSDKNDKIVVKWSIKCDSIKIINSDKRIAYFKMPQLKKNTLLPVKLLVNDGKEEDSIIQQISIPILNRTRVLGLGDQLKDQYSNNVRQYWYIDQKNSGTFATENCGPTAAIMAIKWVDENFSKTPNDARNSYKPNGGWWYTSDIINYLNDFEITNYIISIHQSDTLKTILTDGNIAILCVDMFYISNETVEDWHVDKFYNVSKKGFGHFIIIKGYKLVDDILYYEVYDPNSWGNTYDNLQPKGIDRYYRSEDLYDAALYWWNYAIIISKSKLKNAPLGIYPKSIPHNWGK